MKIQKNLIRKMIIAILLKAMMIRKMIIAVLMSMMILTSNIPILFCIE